MNFFKKETLFILMISVLLNITAAENDTKSVSIKISENFLRTNIVKYWGTRENANLSNPQYLHLQFSPFSLRIELIDGKLYHFTEYLPNKYYISSVSVFTHDEYVREVFKSQFNKSIIESANNLITGGEEALENIKSTEGEEGLIQDIDIPVPQSLEKIFGKRMGRLRISGTQKITIGGSSTWILNPTESDRDQSKWPSPDMKQELNVTLNGTVGERIHVDIKHNSEQTFGDKSKIKLWYEGDEDDIVQRIEAGETNLSLSGSKYVSGSFSSQGLFGIKGEFQLGALKSTVIFSKEEGATSSKTLKPESGIIEPKTIHDKDFIKNQFFLIEPGITDLKVFLTSSFNEDDEVYAQAIDFTTDTTGVSPVEDYFIQQEFNRDYYIDLTSGNDGILQMKSPLSDNQILAVTYTSADGTEHGNWDPAGEDSKLILIKPKSSNYLNVPGEGGDFNPDGSRLWFKNLKNYYKIGGTNLSSDIEITVKLDVYSGSGTGEYIGENEDVLIGSALGLLTSNGEVANDVIDYDAGIIKLPVVINQSFPDSLLPFLNPGFREDEKNYNIYYKKNPDASDVKYNFVVKFSEAGRKVISLGNYDIIEGTEVVKIGNKTLQRNVDYTIDYFSGNLTITTDTYSVDDEISVTYEYTPFFSMGQKTVIGMRNDLDLGNWKIGSTAIYMSESAPESGSPELGKEPNSTWLADIDFESGYDLPFLTRAVDWLPGIETDAESKFDIDGEIAMSIPNPNTKGSAWIDDMEGSADVMTLPIIRNGWAFRSEPYNKTIEQKGDNFFWYNPEDEFQKKDIFADSLLSTSEEDDAVNVLVFDNNNSNHSDSTWIGVMTGFNNGVDLSEKNEISILVKADKGIMHLNFGDINEDFYEPELNMFNTEETRIQPGNEPRNYDNNGVLDVGEDTGLDTLFNQNEPGYSASNPDPNNDDYVSYDNNTQDGYSRYSRVNKWENNGLLDTEDINSNQLIDDDDSYYEIEIDLSVYESESYEITTDGYVNGWRLITVKLNNAVPINITGSLNKWENIEFASIWFDNIDLNQKIHIAEIAVKGNKWDGSVQNGSIPNDDKEYEVTVINNKETPAFQPPPDVDLSEDSQGNIPKEQALVLEFDNFEEDAQFYAYKLYNNDRSFMIYESINFWAKFSDANISDSLPVFVRFGSDTTNYYEYRKKIPTDTDISDRSWSKISLDLNEMMKAKKYSLSESDTTQNDSTKNVLSKSDIYIYPNNPNIRIKGSPSFTKIKRVDVGFVNDNTVDVSGKLLVDNIEITDVKRDIGIAAQTNFSLSFADVGKISVNLEYHDENFHTINSKEGDGRIDNTISLNGNWNFGRFLPSSWKLGLPLNFSWSKSVDKLQFQPNSDLLALPGEDKEYLTSYSLGTTISRSGENSDPWYLWYTINRVKLTYNYKKSDSDKPTLKTNTKTQNGSLSYNISSSEESKIKIYKGLAFYYLPKTVNLSVSGTFTETFKDTKSGANWNSTETVNKTATAKANTSYEPFKSFALSYDIQSDRDLEKKHDLFGINVGWETRRTQNASLNHNMSYIPLFAPSFQYSARYTETPKEQQPELRTLSQNTTMKIGASTELIEISDGIYNSGKWAVSGIAGLFSSDDEDSVKNKYDYKVAGPDSSITGKVGFYYKEALKTIQKINFSFSRSRTSGYKESSLASPIEYQLGFQEDLGEGWSNKKVADDYSISTSFQLSKFRTNLKYTFSTDTDYTPGNQKRTESETYPNASVTWKNLEKLPLLDKLARTSSISTSFDFTEKRNYDITDSSDVFTNKNENYKLSPLVSWKTSWLANFSTDIRFNYTMEYEYNYSGQYKRRTNNKDLNSSLSYSFSAPKGITLPLIGKVNFKSTMNVGVTFNMSWESKIKVNSLEDDFESDSAINENEEFMWEFAPNVNYTFSKNITGGMSFSIKTQKFPNQEGKDKRTVTLHLSVTFKF